MSYVGVDLIHRLLQGDDLALAILEVGLERIAPALGLGQIFRRLYHTRHHYTVPIQDDIYLRSRPAARDGRT